MPETTILSIISKTTDTGVHKCVVVPETPLWIVALNLCPIDGLGAPNGRLPPGVPITGSLRTLCLDSTHPVFTTPAPFSLSVTYDPSNGYKVSAAQVVGQPHAISAIFSRVSDDLAALDPGERTMFLTQVLQVVLAPAQPAQSVTTVGDEGSPPVGKTKQYVHDKGKGKDGPTPLS